MSAWIVSKKHIDTLVQSALAGTTDGCGWTHPGEPFRWYHDEQWHELDPHAEVGDERPAAMEGFNGIAKVPPSQLGQMLWNENRRSVDHRYDEVNEPELYVFEPVTDPNKFLIGGGGLTVAIEALVSSAELAKGIACYEYQSCEHDEWERSEAHAFCRALKENILSSLRGYDAAPWGWD